MSELLVTKICKKCQIEKPLEDFNRQTRGKLGRKNVCKICCSEYNKNKYNNPKFDRENYILNQKVWNEENKKKMYGYIKKSRNKDKDNTIPNPLVEPNF